MAFEDFFLASTRQIVILWFHQYIAHGSTPAQAFVGAKQHMDTIFFQSKVPVNDQYKRIYSEIEVELKKLAATTPHRLMPPVEQPQPWG